MTEEPGEPTPQQRAAETKRKRTREWIITSTIDLYGELKEGDFTRDEIAEAAGVGSTTLSNHFTYKYEVLRQAHERVLAPITRTVLESGEAGTYRPHNLTDELVRIVYSVAKMCHQHRALTVAMIRSFFEPTTYPFTTTELPGYSTGEALRYVAVQLATSPAPGEKDSPIKVFGARTIDPQYHAWALFMALHATNGEDTPDKVTRRVCPEILAAAVTDSYNSYELNERMPAVQEKVDQWFERRKQQEMRGF